MGVMVFLWLSNPIEIKLQVIIMIGFWAVFKHLVFCLQQQMVPSGNDDRSANSHVSVISSNTPFIVHALGDIGFVYVMNMTLWAPPSLFVIANAPIYRLVPFSKRSLRTVVQ